MSRARMILNPPSTSQMIYSNNSFDLKSLMQYMIWIKAISHIFVGHFNDE